MDFQVTKLVYKDDYVKVTVEDEKTSTVFKLLLNDFLNSPLSLNQTINDELFATLQKQHIYCYSYLKALRKLAYNDCSEKEMLQLLHKIQDLSETDTLSIITSLKSMGYLSDNIVSENQLYNDQRKLVGRNKTKYNLLKRGIGEEVITETLGSVDENEELQRGINKAKQLVTKLKGKSYRQSCALIRQGLLTNGFSHIDEIMHELNYEYDEQKEIEALKAELVKYQKRHKILKEDKKTLSSCYNYLYSKGYEYQLIQNIVLLKGDEDENS